MKFGNQERLLRLIPNRETQMEIDAAPQSQTEAEKWVRWRLEGCEKQEWEENICKGEKCEEEAE